MADQGEVSRPTGVEMPTSQSPAAAAGGGDGKQAIVENGQSSSTLDNNNRSEHSLKPADLFLDDDHHRRTSNSSHHHHHHHQHHRRRSKGHNNNIKSRDDRPMGHYPPRRPSESRQESSSCPPTTFIDTTNAHQSQFSESWQELSHQFQEQVGKPSKEALHKFFYPPGNNNGQHHHHHPSPRRRSSKAQHMSVRDREKLKEKAKLKKEKSDSSESHATTEEPFRGPSVVPRDDALVMVESNQGSSSAQLQVELQREEQQQQSTIMPNHPSQKSNPSVQVIRRTTSSGHPSSLLSRNESFQTTPSLPPPTSQNTNFQQSFDAEDEQDRKYVEGFWRVYDDIVMLSLFTQLGVVARLAVSTWFTYFDGVFRHDSPLFTNLPLNCLSCFLLGLLGSGDRLMEMITTRFTPRNLQQRIVQSTDSDDDDDYDDDDLYADESNNSKRSNGVGLRNRRRQRRRSKRAKQQPQKTHFHSWEPPLHWHDDYREVQLLALERRIRSSKCLILFPVMKEDADVMEHYFGDGYKASAEKEHQRRQQHQQQQQQQQKRRRSTRRSRRRRRRFGRQKYCATNLADTDEDNDFPVEYSGDDSGSCEFDYEEDDFGGLVTPAAADADHGDPADGYVDDGRFRFDLELTESTQKRTNKTVTSAAQPTEGGNVATETEADTNIKSPAASLPPSVRKLIKRAPGRTTDGSIGTCPASVTSPPSMSARAPQQIQQTSGGVSVAESQSIQSQQQMQPNHTRTAATAAAAAAAAQDVPSSFGPHQPPQTESSMENGVQMINLGAARSSSSALEQQTPQNEISHTNQSLQEADGGGDGDPQLEHIISNVQANVSENISRIRRVNLADGWDVGTTPEAMADDLMLGLRDGFCGALSSFSSWNSSMLNLLREGHIGEAVVGYMLGIQLPIVAYRFGQQIAVYFFVWRCRRETRRAERMGGYGIRVRMDDDDDDVDDNDDDDSRSRRDRSGSLGESSDSLEDFTRSAETSLDDNALSSEIPSVRAICTALYLLSLVTQCTSLSFFSDSEDQQIALSLLFSPFGTLTRWRLSRFNCWHPGFPLGTFTCNIVACALGGSLGSLLAGNPGPKERILLQSFIAGFAGTLSSLATFIVEILAGMDPLLFRFDGVIYAASSLSWALIVGFVFSASVDWADETT